MSFRPFIRWFLVAALVGSVLFAIGVNNITPSTDESIIALQSQHILFPAADPDLRESMHPKPIFWRFPVLFMAQPYLFPLEAYIAAIPATFLSTNAIGARAVPFALGLGTLFLSFLIIASLGRPRDVWPGSLLLVFPSAYVLMLQFGYALPSYPSHLFLIALGVWLLQRYVAAGHVAWVIMLGVTNAAALAGQLMAIPLPLMCGVLIAWTARDEIKRVWHTLIFGVIAAAGWFPYALAKRLYGGAYDAVSGSYPLREAFGRLWSPALDHVLPVATGIKSTVFPDNTRYIELLPFLTTVWPVLWIALVIGAGLIWCWRTRQLQGRLTRQPAQMFIVFIGLCVAAVLLFIVSKRSHSHTYRYLLNAAWALPFIFAYIHAVVPQRWVKRSIAGLAVVLALLNAATILGVMREWSDPAFAGEEASLYDTAAARAYLEANDLRHVYASYHLAYRLTYLSDQRIIAAQYYNERFHGWPLPYKSYVDLAPRAAYVLAPRFAITADRFENDLQHMGLDYVKFEAGDLTVFHDFAWQTDPGGAFLAPTGLRAATSVNPSAAGNLINGKYAEHWRSFHAQNDTMWVTVHWDEPVELKRIYMYYNYWHHDRAHALALDAWVNGEWVTVRESVPADMDAYEFDNGRPVYGNQFQRIEVDPIVATGLRVRNIEPRERHDWTIGEFRLWGR